MYNILESNIKFDKSGQILSVLVLVEISKGDIRAIEGTNKPTGGYMLIMPNTDYKVADLMQQVAGYGREVTELKLIPTQWKKHFK
ncbi:hypothetical protein [Sphingobacterium paramultivorum]|uniref:hypothetical protein n=1 Tax=Sphingobacterium paramultivorum TaxID=2886510 RepID=UPI00129C8F7A|nr:hypothetical protein [Sphingobacterium paramultivorum]